MVIDDKVKVSWATAFLHGVDGLIPAKLLANRPKRLRARVLVISCLGIGLLTAVSVVVRGLTLPADLGLWIGLGVVLIFFALPVIQWRSGSVQLAGGILSLLLIVSLPVIQMQVGHFPAPVLGWYPGLPLLVTFFLGWRAGLLSAVTSSASVLFLGETMSLVTTEQFAAFFPTYVTVFVLAPVVTYLLAAVYELNRAHNETELRSVNQELDAARTYAEETDRRKTVFLRHMSHELRTPLNAIIGYSELLFEELEDADSPQELTGDAHRIIEASQHLLGLLNGLLDVSKIEAGAVDLVVEDVELDTLVTGLRKTVAPLVADNNNTLELIAEPGLRIHSDRQRIIQILLNLTGNACKFTSDGTIRVTATRAKEGPGVCIEVTDTGVGMSAEKLERVFDAFVQVDESASRRQQGTGLGLAITKKIVELLGGSISVTSAPGVGSTFAVELPLRVEPKGRPAVAG